MRAPRSTSLTVVFYERPVVTTSSRYLTRRALRRRRLSRVSIFAGTSLSVRVHVDTWCRWLRFCRLLAKQKWRGIGVMGVVTILLAALLLCLTAYFEQWGQHLTTSSSLDSSAPAPMTEEPSYFEDKDVPRVFQQYADVHNSATASPTDAKYVVYEIPGNTTLANSLFGLVRELPAKMQ